MSPSHFIQVNDEEWVNVATIAVIQKTGDELTLTLTGVDQTVIVTEKYAATVKALYARQR